jgi:hypothetical protein
MPSIEPKNLSAQINHRARGNPPSTVVEAAISNSFPGLEFDFRNIWKNLFEGIELHEAGVGVMDVVAGSAAEAAGVQIFDRLIRVDNKLVFNATTLSTGPSEPEAAEYSNGLAHIFKKAGSVVACDFVTPTGQPILSLPVRTANLRIRNIFEGAALARVLAEPGALTQSLCSPWQADYRECGCYYWAASRPDFVNAQPGAVGAVLGHDWMQKNRAPGTPYQEDRGGRRSAAHISYDELYTAWEQHLKFIIGGKDKESVP